MDVKIGDRKAEIYTYESDNVVYGLSWSVSLSPLRKVCKCTVAMLLILRLTTLLRHHVLKTLPSLESPLQS